MSCQEKYNKLVEEKKQLIDQNEKLTSQTTSSFNLNKFNSMIDEAAKAVSCNPECQRQKKIDELKQKYLDAKTNLASGPNNVYVSRKNYVVFDQGEPAYNDLITNELTKEAEKITSFYKKNFDDESQNILFSIKTYSGLIVNKQNVYDLYLKYKEENIELFDKLKHETNDVLTNDRKTYYQDQGISNLGFVYYYILVIIYAIFVLGFVIFNFIFPTQTSFKIRIALFVLMILLPFISSWFLDKIILFIYDIYNILPKNAHKTLLQD